MKKIISIILVISFCTLLFSCGKQPDAYEILGEFISAYGADGIIYSPALSEGETGYIPEGLVEKIYVFSGRFPDNYAIFLNSHPESGSECGVFVCDDVEMLLMVEEMCIERTLLIGQGSDRSFIKKSGNSVFYSTMQNKERAERLWKEIIR